MPTCQIKFQTSELVPPPFANAIELKLEETSKGLNYDFEISYLDRDQLSEDEIYEEGFSLEDDYHISGELGLAWKNALNDILKKTKKIKKDTLDEHEDYWEIQFENESFYPKNNEDWFNFLEEIQQAIIEANKFENPLKIEIKRIWSNKQSNLTIKAKFADRSLEFTEDAFTYSKPWAELNNYLMSIYSGEFRYEQANKNLPNKNGLYINLGDEYWFELGKSYLNEPSKIKSLFSNDQIS